MKSVIFVTGNSEKVRDARYVCSQYGIEVKQQSVDIDEIQHHDPKHIARHKALEAYKIIQHPIVINDSSWSIPALGGFPGGYMKDVSTWLSTEDFMNLMQNKDDRTIILTETNVFTDGTTCRFFETLRYGRFVANARGESGPSFARIVQMENDSETIAEIFDRDERNVSHDRYVHWQKFAKWLSKRGINNE